MSPPPGRPGPGGGPPGPGGGGGGSGKRRGGRNASRRGRGVGRGGFPQPGGGPSGPGNSNNPNQPSGPHMPQHNGGGAAGPGGPAGLGEEPMEPPKTDFCQNFVDTGLRPQNFINDWDVETRFDDYPELKQLRTLKNRVINDHRSPATFHKCDLKEFDLTSLGMKFDVILVDPPWEEYVRRCTSSLEDNDRDTWSVEDLKCLNIEAIAAKQSFLFLWVGAGVGLFHGRQLLKKWGFRRCEDICWLKTNREGHEDLTTYATDRTVVQHTTEHCLMGIRGTVKRNTDGYFIHANVDTDVIIAECPKNASTQKPQEMYDIIERFCMGRRRLELFGLDRNIRDGWLTLGRDLTTSNWNREQFCALFDGSNPQHGLLVPTTEAVERLRPKSPPRGEAARGGRGRGGRGGKGFVGKKYDFVANIDTWPLMMSELYM
eukprot:g5605.t1